MPGPRVIRPPKSPKSRKPKISISVEEPPEGAGVGDMIPEDYDLGRGENTPGGRQSRFQNDMNEHVSQLRSVFMDPAQYSEASYRRRCQTLNEMHALDEYTFVKHYQSHVDIFTKWFLTISRGISGQTKIVHYNLQSLVRYGGVASAHLEGTLLTMDNSCLIFLAVVAITYSFVFAIVYGMIDEGREIETTSLEKMTSTMNKVIPFVLGLYVTLALSRWWTIRTEGLGEIFNAIVNIQMILACVMHPERHKPIRTLVMKWSFASVFLLLKAVREQTSLNDMLYKGLLTEHEIDILLEVPDLHGRASMVWGWVLRIVHESFSEAVGPMPYSVQTAKVADIIMNASSGLSIIEMHLGTALPFVYVHIICLLVDIGNLFLVTKAAVVSAVAYHERDWTKMACEILFCLMVPVMYRGLLSVSYTIFDPFGEDVLDFPVGSIMDWNATCCYAVLRAQENFPGVPESVYSSTQNRFAAIPGLKPSQADPDRFEAIKLKFKMVIVNSFRSGKLERVARLAQEKQKREEEAKPHINNAKSNAAMLSATVFAAPIAQELRACGKSMSQQLLRVRQEVYELHRAVDVDASKQREQMKSAIEICDTQGAQGAADLLK